MSETLRVHLALLAVSSIYGVFYIILKLLLQQIGQAELILMRFAFTAALAMAIELLIGRTKLGDAKTVFRVICAGLVGVFMVQIFLIIGINLTTTFHSALIMSTVPILTLSFGILMGRERFNKKRLGGIALAFIGVATLLLSKPDKNPLPTTYVQGDLLILLAASGFAWFLIASQGLLKEGVKSFSLMAYCYLFSAVLFSALFWGGATAGYHDISYDFLNKMDLNGWLMLFYVVVFASIGTYTLNNYALKKTKPSVVSAYIFIQPVLTAFLGVWALHEPFYWDMVLAAGMTFTGVMIATATPDPVPGAPPAQI